MRIPKSFFKPLPAYGWTKETAGKLAPKIHSAQLTEKERVKEKQRQKTILYNAAKKIITSFPTELGHPRSHLSCTLKPLYERIAVLNEEIERQQSGMYYIYKILGSWFIECSLPSGLAGRFDSNDEIYELNMRENEGESSKNRNDAALLAHLIYWWASSGRPIHNWNKKNDGLISFLESTTSKSHDTILDILKTVKPNGEPEIPESYENLDRFVYNMYDKSIDQLNYGDGDNAAPPTYPTKEQIRNRKLVQSDNDVKELEKLLSGKPNNYKG